MGRVLQRLVFFIASVCLLSPLAAQSQADQNGKDRKAIESQSIENTKDSRLLQTINPANPLVKEKIFSVARRSYILVAPNTMQVTDPVSASLTFPTGAMKDGQPVTQTVIAEDVDLGNTIDWLKITLPDSTYIPGQRVTVSVQSGKVGSLMTNTITSDNTVYLYSTSSKQGMQTLGLVLAIILAASSCCCCLLGVKQFYHLIKLAQLFYMLALINAPFKAAGIFGVFSGFWFNIFSVVPLPVKIDEFNGVQCQPPIDFFGESLSCHVYNTLRNYLLGGVIFLVIVGFIQYNKFTEKQFFFNLTQSIKLRMFFWSILPDVLIGVYLNIVAPMSNSVLSFGGLLCMILIVGYSLMFSSTVSEYFQDIEESVEFLGHFSFSRSPLTKNDARLGVKLGAVFIDQLKALTIVTMIVLFYNAPKTQMAIVFIVYLAHAVYLVVVRPWNGLLQNLLQAVSEVCFFIIVLLMYISQDYSDTLTNATRESRISGGQIALFFIIYFCNLIMYMIPVLKGEDLRSTVMHQEKEREQTEGDDGSGKRTGSTGNLAKLDKELVQPALPEGTKPKPLGRDIPTADGTRKNNTDTDSAQQLKRDYENSNSKTRGFEPPKQPHTYGRPGDQLSSQVETQHGSALPPIGEIHGKVPQRPAQEPHEMHKSEMMQSAVLQNSGNPSTSNLGGSHLPSLAGNRSGKQQVRKTFKPQPVTKNDDQI